MSRTAGLKVLSLPFDDETIDVLIGGYLSKDAAEEDYEPSSACGALPARRGRGQQGPRGQRLGGADRPHGPRGGPGAGRGRVPGRPVRVLPLVPLTTGIGAAMGGRSARCCTCSTETKIKGQAGTTIPLGGAGLIVAYPRASADCRGTGP